MFMTEYCSIKISSPIKQEFIIELLDQKTIENITFKFVSKSGINLMFECDTDDKDLAIKVSKKTIKETEIGQVLYFQIT